MIQPISAGLLAALVGFASTFALVLKGLEAVGATQAQAASGLLAIMVVKGLLAAGLSWRLRMPVALAWSTPGAALLLASAAPAGGFPVAVGAFLVTAVLIVVAGLVRPFARAIAAIPAPLAAAMLAGILFGLCTAPVRALAALPALALPIILAWAVTLRLARAWAVPVAVAVTAGLVLFATPLPPLAGVALAPAAILVVPGLSLDAVVGISVPLFVVTMASQNLPGLAVLRTYGYDPSIGPLFVATGLASGLIAIFGGHSVNLAAITAALCAGPDAHPDPARRWIAAATAGLAYVILGLGAGLAGAFVASSPPLLIEAVAGLALLGSFAGALTTALSREDDRLPAMATFVTAASGTSFFGIGAAFWGLLAGGALMALLSARRSGARVDGPGPSADTRP